MIGGFMGVGTPERLVDELVRQGKRNLTVIANDNAHPRHRHRQADQRRRGEEDDREPHRPQPETQKKMLAGELEVDLVPQGTLIERIRAGGFGLGGVLTPTGVAPSWRKASNASRSRASLLLETALRADFALVQAFVADYMGNLHYA
jgi:acetate CoA/acetoacetate CoA-transferase alpha subunit